MSESGYTIDGKFYPMPDGRWRLVFDALTGETKGVYLTPEENDQRDAEEAAYEPIRLASLKALEAQGAIAAVVPELVTAFNELPRLAKAKFASTYDAVELRLSQGRIEDALDIIETAPNDGETIEVKQRLHKTLTTILATVSSGN